MKVSKSYMNVSHAFFHHSHINVRGSSVWVRKPTSKMKKKQSSSHISANKAIRSVNKRLVCLKISERRDHSHNLLKSQLNVLKSVIEHREVAIAFHRVGVIKPKFSLIDLQSLLLIYRCLRKRSSFLV